MEANKARKILRALQKSIPNPKSELKFSSPFELLIAVILSAQATDISVNQSTQKLFAHANTAPKILALGESELIKYIKTIGLYNSKARNIIKTCKILVEDYQGQIPRQRKDLESLPGVGRKTANIILNIVYDEPTIAVDTHIFRVCNRTKLAEGKTPAAVEDKLMAIVPDKFKHDAHHLLLLHGRYVCKAKQPLCTNCAIRHLCEYPDKT